MFNNIFDTTLKLGSRYVQITNIGRDLMFNGRLQ